MKKFVLAMTFVATVAATSLVGVIPAANAADATLNYNDFMATDTYKEFAALSSAYNAAILTKSNIVVEMHTTVSAMGQVQTIDLAISANKTSAKADMTMPDPTTGKSVTISYGYANGSYYQNMLVWAGSGAKNAQEAAGRLGKSETSTVILDSSTPPDGLESIDPASVFGGKNLDVTQGLMAQAANLKFSPMTKSADITDPTSTDYDFTLGMPATALTPAVNYEVLYEFDATGAMRHLEMNGGLPGTLVMSVTADISSPDVLALDLPTDTVHAKAFNAMVKQVTAEKSVTASANAIATKAKALAKASKKALTAKHITDAAKTLKAKVTTVKNGVKLTTTYKGVKGSVCVITAAGITNVNHC